MLIYSLTKIIYVLFDFARISFHHQLPSIIWNFYYDATKLLQADNYVIIISTYNIFCVWPCTVGSEMYTTRHSVH